MIFLFRAAHLFQLLFLDNFTLVFANLKWPQMNLDKILGLIFTIIVLKKLQYFKPTCVYNNLIIVVRCNFCVMCNKSRNSNPSSDNLLLCYVLFKFIFFSHKSYWDNKMRFIVNKIHVTYIYIKILYLHKHKYIKKIHKFY